MLPETPPARPRPLQATGLLDSPPEEVFDRLTRLAARVLGVRAATVSLLDGGRLVHKSAVGVPGALLAPAARSADGSLCARVAGAAGPVLLPDVRDDPSLAAMDAVSELGMTALAGVPLAVGGGPPVGAFCVMDDRPRAWGPEDVRVLADLAAAAAREVEWRCREAGMRDTERELRVQRVQLDELFETAPEAIVLLDVRERVVRANGEFMRVFGYRAEEMAGRPINELIVPPELVEEAERVTRAVTSGRPVSLETTRRRKDGSTLDVWILGKPVSLDDSPVAIYLVYRDMTVHRRAERELRASEERFRQLAENLRDVFFLNSADRSEVLYVSPAYERIWGRPREELYRAPRSWMLALHPGDRERVRATLERAGAEYELEYRIVRPDGEVRWIRDRGIPIRDETGRVYRDAGIAEDVTERRRVEEALRESEARYRQMWEGNRAIKLLLDPDSGAVVDANPAAAAFYGYSAERLRAMRVTDLNALPEEEVHASMRRALEEGGAGPFVAPHRLASGEVRHVEVYTAPVEVHGRTLLYSILSDVTARRRAEEERAAAVAARNRFYTMVSHELRTPISAVMLYNDLLLRGAYGALTESQAEGVQSSQAAAAGLLELVDEVLDLSRLEAGRMETRTEEFAPEGFLREVLSAVRPQAVEHGCELALEVEAAPPVLATDPRRLRQILLNLLSNAVKYGRARPVRLSCRRAGAGRVLLEVTDHGPGIAPEDRERIFEEFVRLKDGGEPGTGIGLTIARRLAELIGARLELDSVVGEGSTFRLVLSER